MDALALVVSIKFPLKLRLTNLRALSLSALRNTTLSAFAIKLPRPSRKKKSLRTRKISFIAENYKLFKRLRGILFHQQTKVEISKQKWKF